MIKIDYESLNVLFFNMPKGESHIAHKIYRECENKSKLLHQCPELRIRLNGGKRING
jgi:hypothetical protein